MEIKQETSKKIGFFTALSILIGSVIGIGIFLKNGGIFQLNGYNGTGILISWIVGAVIAITAAISFAEVGTSLKSRSGLAGWIEKFWGHKVGYFIKITQPVFYMGLMLPILSFFSTEALILIFSVENIHYGYIVLASLFLMILFISFNFLSLKKAGIFSNVTTLLKFVPLLTIIIWGIVFSIQNGTVGLFDPKNPNDIVIQPISATAILASIPSVLFAFDSFTNVGNLALDIKKPNKNVPLVIIVGMISCAIFYLLVTISQIFFMQGNSFNIFSDLTNSKEWNIGLSIGLKVFMTISILGVLNSFSCTSLRSFSSLVDEELIFCHKKISVLSTKLLPKFSSNVKSGFILSLFINGFWFLILGISAVSKGDMGSDIYIDGVSNYPTLFFFGVYGFVILGGLINRKTNKVEVVKQKTFLFAAPLAVFGSFFIFAYQFFFVYLYQAIENPTAKLEWGLFYSNNEVAYRWEGMVFFFVFLFIFIICPFINYFLYKKFNDNKSPIVKG